ncbi:MAG: Lrp/AsnC family transcriptional regulator [Candidatus Bathyarchaeota archaeon]
MSPTNAEILEALDKTDYKILHKLQANSQISYEELGKSVNLAESTVRYRVKKLEEQGIIHSYMTVLDAKKLGFDLFIFSELDVEAGKEQLVAQKLQKFKNVIGLFSVSGPPDMIAIILARDNGELAEIVRKIRAIQEVHKMICIFALKAHKLDLAIKIPLTAKKNE